jgi:hypothetical protein
MFTMARCYRSAACALLVALACSCGKAPPEILKAEGIVRLDGKPLNKARVVFIPVADVGREYRASGLTDEAGRYRLTCNGQPGACAGENRVLVLEGDIPQELRGESLEVQARLVKYQESLGNRPIPGRYGTVAQSPLKATVKAGQTEYPLDLTR